MAQTVRFAVLGAGAWGTAIALVLARNQEHCVALWSARPEHGRLLEERRENTRLLPGVPIPANVLLTTDIAQAGASADLLIAAVPTAHLRATMARVSPALAAKQPVLSLVKGIENATFRRPSEILTEVLGERPIAVLSGPSHAEEVARGMPTSLVAASEDLGLARWIQERMSSERFRVYTNLDTIGVELAGALKNIIGIAAGICDGLGYGDNAKAALLTRGLAEMARFGIAHGAEAQTYWGLAGMGDLITTCFSKHGRNRAVGERIAKGEKPTAVVGGMEMVAEGVNTTASVFAKAMHMGLSMPITVEVHQVLFEGKNPRDAVNDLMLREPRHEGG